MLPRELLREDLERVRRALDERGQDRSTLDRWSGLDGERLAALTEVEALKRRLNEASREVGQRKAKQEPADQLIAEVGELKGRIETLEGQIATLESETAAIEQRIPNNNVVDRKNLSCWPVGTRRQAGVISQPCPYDIYNLHPIFGDP